MVAAAQIWVLLGILGVLSTGLVTAMGLAFASLRSELVSASTASTSASTASTGASTASTSGSTASIATSRG